MKKQVWIIGLMAAMTMSAQNQPAQITPDEMAECEALRVDLGAPYYYCDCHYNSDTFAFPLEKVVNDTMWYSATMNDLKQGISAYWFSDCSVVMELYTYCTNKEPVYSLTVGRNQMRDMDAAMIQKKIDEFGEGMQGALADLKPHMRVYPVGGGTGRVYCYPYNQGPESTCDDPLPLRPGMTYVCEKEENAYKLEYSLIASTGKAFIHWKQEKNLPCEIWLTLDSCTGEEIDRATLSDSMHVHVLDSAKLVQARKAKRAIWLHVKHAKDRVGRIYYYTNPKFAEDAPAIEKSTCLGKTLNVNGKTYGSDTTFVETVWLTKDTLQATHVSLTFTVPDMIYDTLYLYPSEVMAGYRVTKYNYTVYAFGDKVLEVKKANTCTKIVQLTVIEKPEPEPTGWVDANADRRTVYKHFRDGQLIITVDNRRYTILGQQIKN